MTGADVRMTLSNILVMFVSYNASNPQNLQSLIVHTNKPGTVNKQFVILPFTDGRRKVIR